VPSSPEKKQCTCLAAMESPKTFERMKLAAPAGGYLYQGMTEEEAVAQRKAIMDLIKKIGVTLATGKSLTNISFPVSVFEPRSYLQRLLDGWWSAPTFMTKAAATKDPVLRFKYVMTFAVSGFNNTCAQMKPFNPILGETNQATFGDGTQIYCEQSSHHPPISNFLVIGPNESYRFYGYGEWHASFSTNTVKGHQKGPHFVEFPDGTLITYTLPWMNVNGVLHGDRIIEYEGVMEFRDETNGLSCNLEVNPKQETKSGGFFSWGRSQTPKLPSDYLRGKLYKGDEVISDVQGTWLGCIEFDDERLWDFNEDYVIYEAIGVDDPLPSDCRFRDDVRFLAEGDKEKAQKEKERLEEKQRYEAKLRKEGDKIRKKRAKKAKKQKEQREPRIFKKPT